MKKVAIMQPYFLPYIGYWQLLAAVDEFIVYDNIQYTKKGWFNRNRILSGGQDKLFTIPVKKDSDFLTVIERSLADDALKENSRTLRVIEMTYKRAPYFEEVYPLLRECFLYQEKNLFRYLHNSIDVIAAYLDIGTQITVSSTIAIDHSLKSQQKVIELCKSRTADVYVNPIGGTELYDKAAFSSQGLELRFLKSDVTPYAQYDLPFVPALSIIDVLMFNGKEQSRKLLGRYELQ